MSRQMLAKGIVIASLTATSIGIAITQTASKSIDSLISSNYENWKGKFNSVRNKLIDEGINDISEWDDKIWNKWISRLHEFVPEEFKSSIVDEVWMFAVDETLNSKNKNIPLSYTFVQIMNGEVKIGDREYQHLIKKIKESKDGQAIVSESSETKKDKKVNLSEKDKREILNSINESYRKNKKEFKEAREEWLKQGKGDIPQWDDEAWKKSVAHFYIYIPDKTKLDRVVEGALYRMLASNKEKSDKMINFVDFLKKRSAKKT